MDETTPRILADVAELTADPAGAAPGAAWRLEQEPRDLDANVVRLPPGGRNEPFDGPALDILVHVVAGSGLLHTADQDVPADKLPAVLAAFSTEMPGQKLPFGIAPTSEGARGSDLIIEGIAEGVTVPLDGFRLS